MQADLKFAASVIFSSLIAQDNDTNAYFDNIIAWWYELFWQFLNIKIIKKYIQWK